MGLGAEDFKCCGVVLAELCPRSHFHLRVRHHVLAVSVQQGPCTVPGGGGGGCLSVVERWQCMCGAMRQRILGSHTPLCHRRMVITTLSSMFALLADQIGADCCLACATPGGYRMFFGCLGQLAPTTLPQPQLVSKLSLCGPLSLSLCFFLFALPKGFVLLFALPRGFLFLFALPTGFSLALSLVFPPPLCLPVQLRRTAVRTAACSATCRGTVQRPL